MQHFETNALCGCNESTTHHKQASLYFTCPFHLQNMILFCLETCTTACHNGDAWIQGPVHLLVALALFLLAFIIHQASQYRIPHLWLYTGSIPIASSITWEICSFSILGSWNWPRLLWPCSGIITLLTCLGFVSYKIEQSFPGLTSSYFRGDDS